MAPKIQDRPLAFAVPAVGNTALLPQTVALGVTVEMARTNDEYFNVGAGSCDNDPNGEMRFYIVRRACRDDVAPEGRWIVERPASARARRYGVYETAAVYREEHLRAALGFAAVHVAADWIIEVRDGGTAR